MPNTGPSDGFAQHHDALLAELVQPFVEADAGGGLAFAGGCGAQRGHQDQLALGRLRVIDQVERQLGLGAAIGFDDLRIDTQGRAISAMGFICAFCAISRSEGKDMGAALNVRGRPPGKVQWSPPTKGEDRERDHACDTTPKPAFRSSSQKPG
jgi:hypothetical protein